MAMARGAMSQGRLEKRKRNDDLQELDPKKRVKTSHDALKRSVQDKNGQEGDNPNRRENSQEGDKLDVLRDFVQIREKEISQSSRLNALDLAIPKQVKENSEKNRPEETKAGKGESSRRIEALDLAVPKQRETISEGEASKSRFMNALDLALKGEPTQKKPGKLQKPRPEKTEEKTSKRSKLIEALDLAVWGFSSLGDVVKGEVEGGLKAVEIDAGGARGAGPGQNLSDMRLALEEGRQANKQASEQERIGSKQQRQRSETRA
jgi:hypothetical protein